MIKCNYLHLHLKRNRVFKPEVSSKRTPKRLCILWINYNIDAYVNCFQWIFILVQALTGIPDIPHRWLKLTARWHYRLRYKDDSHMTTAARLASRGTHPKRRSCYATFGHNSILAHMDEMQSADSMMP